MDGSSARIAWSCFSRDSRSAAQAGLLELSLRQFGGSLAESPFRVMTPDQAETPVSIEGLAFAGKVWGAAAAEAWAEANGYPVLVWTDADSVVVREPTPMLLPPGVAFGYRPVDLALIGSPWGEAPDAFWQLVYEGCGVERIEAEPPITTSVDQRDIRPYFNAGMLVVRPEAGLLRAWRDNLLRLHSEPRFQQFLNPRELHWVFFHQAVLAGTVLTLVPREARLQLPHFLNYPLHLHARYPEDRRPASLAQLLSFRHDDLFDRPGWVEMVPAAGSDQPVLSWLQTQLISNRAPEVGEGIER